MSEEEVKASEEEEKVAVAASTEAAAKPEESAKTEEPAEPKKKEETAEDLLKSELDGVKIRRAKGSKNITSGVVNVLATFNNTKVTFTDARGNVISWSSAGKCNFRGSRKSTAYAAQVVTQDAGRTAMSHGMKEVVVKLKGPGMGRDSAVRALQSLGMIVTEIVDVTPVPHNGCRAPKRRRV
ncbi:MAG: 30S ribosomal protein S11 [Opitutales bacterium]